jgi:hypothetical protein
MIGFLCNPFKVGAYCARVIIPYEGILEFWDFLFCKAKERHKRFSVEKPEFNRDYYEFMRSAGVPEFVDKILDDMLNFLLGLKDVCPEEIKKWSDYGNVVVVPEYYQAKMGGEEGFFFFAPQTYFEDIQDALSIRVDYKAIPDFVAEVTSLTPKALSVFKSFVMAIPCAGKVTYRDEGKRHSKRFVFDLYPAVAALWIDCFAHKYISRDLIEFLSEAIDYIDKREWRMSILLSAFSVETLLSDIYEEILHKEAPEAPIGFLIQKIDETRKFPPEAMKLLKTLNRIRKSAVHRGLMSFTQKEAILALMSALQFILWYSFEGRTFCNMSASL